MDPIVGYHLWHATTRWRRALADALVAHDLTPPQFFLLASLYRIERKDGEAPSQRALAQRTGLDAMTTSQGVRALEGKRLVARRDDPADGRAFRLALTEAGLRVAAAATAAARDVDRRFFAPLGSGRQRFVDDLRTLEAGDG